MVKRENFRSAFKHFDFNEIAKFTSHDVSRLLEDKGIVRHRGKIEAVINNSQRAQEMVKQFGSLGAFFWQYEPKDNQQARQQIVSTSDESIRLSKELKKLGWKFVGPTTAYAFMQAMGLVNDHTGDCFVADNVNNARSQFKRPKIKSS